MRHFDCWAVRLVKLMYNEGESRHAAGNSWQVQVEQSMSFSITFWTQESGREEQPGSSGGSFSYRKSFACQSHALKELPQGGLQGFLGGWGREGRQWWCSSGGDLGCGFLFFSLSRQEPGLEGLWHGGSWGTWVVSRHCHGFSTYCLNSQLPTGQTKAIFSC